jgi:hypothetical protein
MPLHPWHDRKDSPLVAELQAAFDKVKFNPESSPTGWIDLIRLRNLVEKALSALRAADAGGSRSLPSEAFKPQADIVRDLLTIIDVAMPKELQDQDIRIWRAREFLASLEPDYRPSPTPSASISQESE